MTAVLQAEKQLLGFSWGFRGGVLRCSWFCFPGCAVGWVPRGAVGQPGPDTGSSTQQPLGNAPQESIKAVT